MIPIIYHKSKFIDSAFLFQNLPNFIKLINISMISGDCIVKYTYNVKVVMKMLEKTKERKVLRDPIHGYIHVDLQVVWDCINAKEVQRLRRIHQLGGDFQVYHTAEHSRFSHSLGVYEIVRRMVSEIYELHSELSEYEKATVMLAGLLHDVGHGPFSHAFESISILKHEEYTKMIILGDSEIHKILSQAHEDLPRDVANIIMYEHPNEVLNQLVSGQLDADRMDYLLRDAYFTGTSYGNFDLERIIRTIRIVDQRLAVKDSGIHSVEDYIMARYHMYWQVYLHPVARSFEGILTQLFMRMKDLYVIHPQILAKVEMFHPFLSDQPYSIHDLYQLDEAAAFYGFSILRTCDDEILRDLAHRVLDRDLFEYKTVRNENEIAIIKEKVKQAEYDPTYYVFTDKASQKLYSPYKMNESGHNIWIVCSDGEVRELSMVSDIVRAICHAKTKEDKKVYFPNIKL